MSEGVRVSHDRSTDVVVTVVAVRCHLRCPASVVPATRVSAGAGAGARLALAHCCRCW